MSEQKPNRQGQGTGSSPNRDPQYGTQGGVAGQKDCHRGAHPMRPQSGRPRHPNDGTQSDDNKRAEKPVAE